IDLAGDDVGLELERAAPRVVEPDVDAGEIAGRHRSPSQRGAGRGLLHSPFQVEENSPARSAQSGCPQAQFSPRASCGSSESGVTGAANEPERSRKSRSLSLGIAVTLCLITKSYAA